MRVIAGEYRSRVLAAPKGMSTRPTSDRLRETLFNVLAPRIAGACFLDLYAGSGAVGIEALSRGAAQVVFVERSQDALRVLRQNLERLGVGGRVQVQAAGATTFLRSATGKFDVVFLDPPYDAEEEYAAVLGRLGGLSASLINRDTRSPLLSGSAVVVAEHRRKIYLEERFGALERTRLLKQGDAGLSFYSVRQ